LISVRSFEAHVGLRSSQQLGMPVGRLDAELGPEPDEPAAVEPDPMLPEPVEPDPVEPEPMLLVPVEPDGEPDTPAPLEVEPLLVELVPGEDLLSLRT
jgi:hypothetical protein